MRTLLCCLLTLVAAERAVAQRPVRLGPTVSIIALDDGGTQQFSSFGGSVALLTGDDAEVALLVARYGDLSTNTCERSLTFVGLDSYYYPVGPTGFAPFASTTLGLARVIDGDPGLLDTCLPASPSNELGFGFGLGLRINLGADVAGVFEGRFFQVPHSAIQALEARANLAVAFGKRRVGQFLAGTVGPAVGFLVPLSGPVEGRGPLLGARFRRDTKKAGTVALEIHYAPLRIVESCTTLCEPHAILFAPGYEASLHPAWGRAYAGLGALLAGFPGEGPDRGMAQGAQGGFGVDLFAGTRALVNVGARVLWLRRGSGENAFFLQLGGSVSPRIRTSP